MANNIVLIGFMGTGKSAISKGLNKKYGLDIIDTDALIEKREGRKISKIFEENGEEYFRNLETELLKELASSDNLVISCGGGMALRDENAALMKEAGTVFLLSATPETIYHRVKGNNNRPLLRGHMNVEYIGELLEKRLPKYEAAADVVIDVNYRSVDDICKEIYSRLGE